MSWYLWPSRVYVRRTFEWQEGVRKLGAIFQVAVGVKSSISPCIKFHLGFYFKFIVSLFRYLFSLFICYWAMKTQATRGYACRLVHSIGMIWFLFGNGSFIRLIRFHSCKKKNIRRFVRVLHFVSLGTSIALAQLCVYLVEDLCVYIFSILNRTNCFDRVNFWNSLEICGIFNNKITSIPAGTFLVHVENTDKEIDRLRYVN